MVNGIEYLAWGGSRQGCFLLQTSGTGDGQSSTPHPGRLCVAVWV
jgi:hypothetical protein